MKEHKKAVILCSGGIDSSTVMALARKNGYTLYSLSFRYNQRHAVELESARRISRLLGAERHMIMDIDLGLFGGSCLTDNTTVPKNRVYAETENEIPSTYVPARNTIFLSLALAWAEVLGSRDIFIGVNSVDYSGYPDCRKEFITAFEAMANVATRASVTADDRITIHAPLIRMTKAEIIRSGVELGVDYGLTHSCYDPDPDGKACGQCDSCLFRRKGFKDAGIPDPTVYR